TRNRLSSQAITAHSARSIVTQMFPNEVSTEQESMVVVKKLLAIAVSSITYLRGLFPEKAYGSKDVEGQKVMILREDHKFPAACQIVKW
uniref:HORMA domain-containing protein n=1 Tax=Myripristis murdjan TaxID=586833 RepID=A0A667YND4_9TELE